MSFDYQIAARTLWGEARGEGPDGIRAVAHVLVNRKNSGRWGKTFATVCLWPWQFSCWNHADPNWQQILEIDEADPLLLQCYGAIVSADTLADTDPVQGSMYYEVTNYGAPWAKGHAPVTTIGRQSFYNDIG